MIKTEIAWFDGIPSKIQCIVWFNGPSAKALHKTLPKNFVEFGCNFIRKDRAVDHVCVYDPITKPLIKIEDGVKYWARNGQQDNIFNEVVYPMNEQPENSGMLALYIAIKLGFKKIYIIGCDWGITNKTIYTYKRESELKYRNNLKALMKQWQTNYLCDINIIHSEIPDVLLTIVDPQHFLSKMNVLNDELSA